VLTITVHENQYLQFPPGINKKSITDRLYRLSNRLPFKIFEYSKGKLKATGVVGTICDRNLRVEILPKISTESCPLDDRNFLINVLRFSKNINQFHAHSGEVTKTKGSLLEAMITEVALELLDGLRNGVPRRYSKMREDSPVIKGRIDFQQLSRRMPNRMEKIPITYHPLIAQNSLTQLLKWTATKLIALTCSSKNREILSHAISLMSDIDLKGFSRKLVMDVRLNRFEETWSRTVSIAKLIAENNAVDPTSSGKEQVFSMVFPLHQIFERSLRVIFNTTLNETLFQATHQTKQFFLLENCYKNSKSLRIRPDFIFLKGNNQIVSVGDAKWKHLVKSKTSYDIKPGDLYQLTTYMTKYEVDTGFLFFPKASWMNEDEDNAWVHSFILADSNKRVHLVAIDLQSFVSPNKAKRQKAIKKLQQVLLAGF
jgi:5-methylcytosine-specific restriction enzyme subunit McrC